MKFLKILLNLTIVIARLNVREVGTARNDEVNLSYDIFETDQVSLTLNSMTHFRFLERPDVFCGLKNL